MASSVTKQHFELVAAAIREAGQHNAVDETYREGWHSALSAVSMRLASEFAAANPRFDRARFLDACHARGSHDSRILRGGRGQTPRAGWDRNF